MKKIILLLISSILLSCSTSNELKFKRSMHRAIDQSLEVQTMTDSITLYGTMTLPQATKKVPLCIIIAGSGPTDRNCNNPFGKSNAYKMIAEELMDNGIATIRYDKRMIGESVDVAIQEKDLRFDHMVDDASNWVKLFENDPRFSSITIMGHSEGSLIGILTAQRNSSVTKFVSLAGPAQAADVLLLEQIGKQLPFAVPNIKKIFEKLKQGEFIEEIDPTLMSILRPSVQAYMASWFQYTPTTEIAKLKIPSLIIQGTTDIQVETSEAELLHEASPNSELLIIPQSNHILKDAPEDRIENIKTYSDPSLPLSDGVVDAIINFVFQKS